MDLGLPEIGMLLVLGVVMFGPERIPPMARKAAKIVHFLRGIANDAQDQLRSELGPEYADLELTDLHPKNFVKKHLLTDLQEDLEDIKEDLGTIKKDLEAEGKDLSKVEAALRSTDEALDATESAMDDDDMTSSHAPFDIEAT